MELNIRANSFIAYVKFHLELKICAKQVQNQLFVLVAAFVKFLFFQ